MCHGHNTIIYYVMNHRDIIFLPIILWSLNLVQQIPRLVPENKSDIHDVPRDTERLFSKRIFEFRKLFLYHLWQGLM